MKRVLLLLLSFLLCISFVNAMYYADVQIFVDEAGQTKIFGTSNYENLSQLDYSSDYTSKDGKVWTLNITVEEEFDNFIYELNLPKNTEINYIKTTPTFRIADGEENLQIIGTGENRHFVIVVQYTINSNSAFDEDNNFLWFIILFLIVLLVFRFLGFRLRRKDGSTLNEREVKSSKEKAFDKQVYEEDDKGREDTFDHSVLPERQQEIIRILEKEGRMTQKQLEAKMKIPKSSVSRNVKSLISRKIIEKEKGGQSNYISLRK